MAVAQPPVYVSISNHCDLLTHMHAPEGPPTRDMMPILSPYSVVSEAGIEGRAMQHASVEGVPGVAAATGSGGPVGRLDDKRAWTTAAARIVVRPPGVDRLFPVIGTWRRERETRALAASAAHVAQAFYQRRFHRSNVVVVSDGSDASSLDAAGRPAKRPREVGIGEGEPADDVPPSSPMDAADVNPVCTTEAPPAVTMAAVLSVLASTLLTLEDARVSPHVKVLLLNYSPGSGGRSGSLRFLLGWRPLMPSSPIGIVSSYLSLLINDDGEDNVLMVEEKRCTGASGAAVAGSSAVHYPKRLSSMVDVLSKLLFVTDCLEPLRTAVADVALTSSDGASGHGDGDANRGGGGGGSDDPAVSLPSLSGRMQSAVGSLVATVGGRCVVDVLAKLAIALRFDNLFSSAMHSSFRDASSCVEQWSVAAASIAETPPQEPALQTAGNSGATSKSPTLRTVSCILRIASRSGVPPAPISYATEVHIVVPHITLRALAAADEDVAVHWKATTHRAGVDGRHSGSTGTVTHGTNLATLHDEILRIARNSIDA